MPRPTSKDALLEEIASERRRLEQNITAVAREEMTMPGVVGEWSMKDLLAHLAAWEQLFLSWYTAGLRGQQPQTPVVGRGKRAIDALNACIYEQNRARPLDDVLAEFARSYEQVLATVREIPEEDIFTPARHAWTGGLLLLSYITANTSEHYRWAKGHIRAWMRARGRP
jgi:hypothetical protein